MKRIFLAPAFIIATLVITACSTVNSTVYTKGAVQSARSQKKSLMVNKRETVSQQALCINPFIDLRDRPEDTSRLWMCAVPVLSVFSRWEKTDWLNWDTKYYAGYKPFSVDLVEVVKSELTLDGINCAPAGETPLILDGTIEELTLTLRPHFWGTSFIIGEYLGLMGIPMGSWDVEQRLKFRLSERNSNKVVWQKTYATKTNGSIAAYYGKNPLSHGYPYVELLEPVLKDVTDNVRKYVVNRACSTPVEGDVIKQVNITEKTTQSP